MAVVIRNVKRKELCSSGKLPCSQELLSGMYSVLNSLGFPQRERGKCRIYTQHQHQHCVCVCESVCVCERECVMPHSHYVCGAYAVLVRFHLECTLTDYTICEHCEAPALFA